MPAPIRVTIWTDTKQISFAPISWRSAELVWHIFWTAYYSILSSHRLQSPKNLFSIDEIPSLLKALLTQHLSSIGTYESWLGPTFSPWDYPFLDGWRWFLVPTGNGRGPWLLPKWQTENGEQESWLIHRDRADKRMGRGWVRFARRLVEHNEHRVWRAWMRLIFFNV